RALVVAAAAIAIAVIGLVVATAMREPSPPPPSPTLPPLREPSSDPLRPGSGEKEPPASTDPIKLVLGKAPEPLATPPPGRFRDLLARDEFRRGLDDGDAAWEESDAARALACWRSAAAQVKERVPELDERIRRAGMESALARARAAATSGDARV